MEDYRPGLAISLKIGYFLHEFKLRQMTKLVIFDLDGTLLDTLEDLAISTNHALAQNGFPQHDTEAYRFFVGNM